MMKIFSFFKTKPTTEQIQAPEAINGLKSLPPGYFWKITSHYSDSEKANIYYLRLYRDNGQEVHYVGIFQTGDYSGYARILSYDSLEVASFKVLDHWTVQSELTNAQRPKIDQSSNNELLGSWRRL